MNKFDPWYIQYHMVRAVRNWRTWPIIRHFRAMWFRRVVPFGQGRHGPISVIRYYWANFLEHYREDFRGRALEIGTYYGQP